jgi:hypothetical protein
MWITPSEDRARWPSRSNCNCRAVQDIHTVWVSGKVPAPRLGDSSTIPECAGADPTGRGRSAGGRRQPLLLFESKLLACVSQPRQQPRDRCSSPPRTPNCRHLSPVQLVRDGAQLSKAGCPKLPNDRGQGHGPRIRSALGCGAAIVPTIAGPIVIHLAGLDRSISKLYSNARRLLQPLPAGLGETDGMAGLNGLLQWLVANWSRWLPQAIIPSPI